MEYRKSGLALIEQGISDTLCSLDPDLIPWDILEQVEVFFSISLKKDDNLLEIHRLLSGPKNVY